MVNRAGFSLVEMTVAMVLLAIGLLGVAGTGLLAARMLSEAEAREAMLERAGSVLDSVIAYDVAGGGMTGDARFQLEWSSTAEAVEIRARMPDGSPFDLRAIR